VTRGLTSALMALMPLKMGGLRGELRGGIKAGWSGGGGGAAELERPEVRDGADSQGPLDRETRGK
jgi:hypothetical protein